MVAEILGPGLRNTVTGIHEISSTLANNGITTFYSGFLSLGAQDCIDLIVPKFDGHPNGDGAKSGAPDPYNDPAGDPCDEIDPREEKTISKVYGRQLHAMLVFCHYECA
jgi:hypothetical protein